MSTFRDMSVGDIAVVTNVSGSGQLRKRMLDLELTRGAKVELIQIARLGDPIEIQLRGFRLTVRKVEAEIVELDIIHRAKEAKE
jgi:ferrous iron transport protein A